ncbi:TadE/TadG family type IV pilus assembly protein [Nocardioides luti]|uniref:TadE/TadG family type IV pilus assembly protein n=1 Tax=Nocardioides luti TaxID=2761101 RepID=UPI001C895C3A
MRLPSAARPRRDATGAAAVEFALVVPILLLLVFGIIQYGMYFWAMQGGSDIARSAARLSAVGQPATCSTFTSDVRAEVDDLTGTGSTATVKRTYVRQNPGSVTVGDTVEVTVSFTSFDLQLPFLPFIDDGKVTTTTQSRVDFAPVQPEDCP